MSLIRIIHLFFSLLIIILVMFVTYNNFDIGRLSYGFHPRSFVALAQVLSLVFLPTIILFYLTASVFKEFFVYTKWFLFFLTTAFLLSIFAAAADAWGSFLFFGGFNGLVYLVSLTLSIIYLICTLSYKIK